MTTEQITDKILQIINLDSPGGDIIGGALSLQPVFLPWLSSISIKFTTRRNVKGTFKLPGKVGALLEPRKFKLTSYNGTRSGNM